MAKTLIAQTVEVVPGWKLCRIYDRHVPDPDSSEHNDAENESI